MYFFDIKHKKSFDYGGDCMIFFFWNSETSQFLISKRFWTQGIENIFGKTFSISPFWLPLHEELVQRSNFKHIKVAFYPSAQISHAKCRQGFQSFNY